MSAMTRRHVTRLRRFYNAQRRWELLNNWDRNHDRAQLREDWCHFNSCADPITQPWQWYGALPPPRWRNPAHRREHAQNARDKVAEFRALAGW